MTEESTLLTSKKISLFFICLIFSFYYSNSQDFNLDNNARKAISIWEDKFANETIKLLYDPKKPFIEQSSYIDNRSNIIIYIDRDSLGKFKDFIGAISLTAKINNRLIEVNPYSEVGKELKTVGINGLNSTRDFASSLLSFLVETNRFHKNLFCRFIEDYNSSLNSNGTLIKKKTYLAIQSQIFNFENSQQRLSDSVAVQLKFIRSHYIELSDEIGNINIANSADLRSIINRIKTNVEYRLNSLQTSDINYQTVTDLFKIQTNLNLIKSYLDYLSNSNDETSRAYSKSVERDPIFVRHISRTFSGAIATYNSILDDMVKAKTWKENEIQDIKMRSALMQIDYVIKQVRSLTKILLPKMEEFLDQAKRLNSKKESEEDQEYDPYLIPCSNYDSDQEKLLEYYNIAHIRKAFIESLAIKASSYIYNKLEPAVIDLRKEDAKEGDILRIFINRYNSEGEQSSKGDSTKKEILLATYDIKELGFRMKISDSFLLIKRGNDNSNDPDNSPSRWKGAPGATLMWSYGSDGGKNKFYKWWEPSFGINVSYLDFYKSKDIEIGAGIVIGIFRNKIFFTYGANLNAEKYPSYFGLGFSFTNLASKLIKE